MASNNGTRTKNQAGLIRIGGAALLLAFAIHVLANVVLKQFPPEAPSLPELKAYFEAEASTWGIVHGLRYIAVACLAVFLGGMIARVRCTDESSGGWEHVGLVGGVMLLANLLITNGIETFAFFDFALLSEQPELFWLVFNMTRVLFTAEIVTWAILIFGFSMAGWSSASLPRALLAIGFAAAACGFVSGASVTVVMKGNGLISLIDAIGAVASLIWFVCTGIWMLWRGDR